MPHNGLRMAFSVPLDLGPAHFRATKINFRKTATDENLGTTAMRQRGRHHLERNSQAKRALSPHRGHCPRRHPPPSPTAPDRARALTAAVYPSFRPGPPRPPPPQPLPPRPASPPPLPIRLLFCPHTAVWIPFALVFLSACVPDEPATSSVELAVRAAVHACGASSSYAAHGPWTAPVPSAVVLRWRQVGARPAVRGRLQGGARWVVGGRRGAGASRVDGGRWRACAPLVVGVRR